VEGEGGWVGSDCGFAAGLVDVADEDFGAFGREGLGDAGAET
jgi:hypothetical protein